MYKNSIHKFLFYLIAILCLATKSLGQELNYLHYTDKDGLPSNEIYGIEIDNKGYLWAVTDKGIAKYDGNKFEVFTTINNLNDNVYFNIMASASGKIWLWAYNFKYNYIENGKIQSYKYNHLIEKIADGDYSGTSICEGKNGDMFFQVNKKFFSISQTGTITYFDKIAFGRNIIVTLKNNTLVNHGHVDAPIERLSAILFKMENYTQIIQGLNNKFFVLVSGKIIYSDSSELTIKQFNHQIESLIEDDAGKIWVSHSLNKLEIFNHINDEKPTSIFNNISGKLVKDKFGNVWFSNSYTGLYKFPSNNIKSILCKEANVLTSIVQYGDNLIMQSYNNKFNIFNIKTKESKTLSFSELIPFVKPNENLIHFNHNDKLSFFAHNCLVSKDQIFAQFSARAIQRIHNNTYISIGNNGVRVFNNLGTVLKLIPAPSNQLKDVEYISESKIYIASNIGLLVYDGSKTQHEIPNDEYKTEHIQCILRIGDLLILGSKGKGIIVYNFKSKTVETALNTNAKKFYPNSINCLQYHNGIIWAGTNIGICKLAISNHKIQLINRLDVNNGLRLNDVLGIHLWNNKLYAITLNYLNILDLTNPKLFELEKPNIPDIIKIYNNYELKSYTNSTISEDYTRNNFEFIVNSPYLANKNRLSFFYKLENYHTHWVETRENSIKLVDLPSGEYVLKIYSSVDNGTVNSEIKYINIHIKKPIWKTTWFKLLLLLVIVILFFVAMFIYFFIKNNKLKRSRELAQFQQNALRSQLKPHFIFNTLNSIQNYVIRNNMESATDFIEKFARLTRYVLDTSDYELMPIKNELEIITAYLEIEQERFKNFDFQIIVAEGLETDLYKLPTLILQPLIENAIWHGIHSKNQKGEIIIRIEENLENILLSVEDDGIGRIKKTKAGHVSKGIQLIQNRLDLLGLSNAGIQILDKKDSVNNPIGTKVIIVFPKLK